ncbi:MAG: hypothetical protein ACOY93_01920 [Bacillota bacterium]
MAVQPMYVVLVRDRGLFLVQPLEGESQAEAIEKSLGLKGGYSGGLVELEVPEGVDEAWVAWVEGEGPTGAPYFEYRALHPDLTEEQVNRQLEAAGETAIKLNRSRIYREADRTAAPEPEGPPIEWQG